jgi:two-component system, NarL family, invasion response regulator UvrY
VTFRSPHNDTVAMSRLPAPGTQPLRVLVIDDHAVVRDGVRGIVAEEWEQVAVGEAGTAEEALARVGREEWDVAVLDISLGARSGLDVLKQMKVIRPALPVLVLSMHSEEQYARRAFRAGAAGFITKGSGRAELVRAVHRLVAGQTYVSPALADTLITDLQRGISGMPHEALSDRELEVMRLIASGKTVGEIAGQLSLSNRTVSTYRARVLDKMRMRTNADLAHYVFENKLLE